MKTIIATAMATLLVGTFSIPVGEPRKTVIIADDMVTYEDGISVEGAIQIIQGNVGEVQTATCTVYFVVE